jgi:hypothetical protein
MLYLDVIKKQVMIKIGLKELGIMIGGGVITFVVVLGYLYVLEALGI